MKLQKYTKTSISILLTLLLSYGLVSAWTNLSSVTTGDTLTATVWNDMVTKLNDAGQRASGIFTDGGGKVGIGTSSPGGKLSIHNSASDTYSVGNSNLYIRGSNQGFGLGIGTRMTTPAGVWFQGMVNDSVGATNILLNPDSGNVGIGTYYPAQKLEVVGAIKSDYLVVDPQGVAGEGGEMVFMGEGSYSNIQVDNYSGNFRVFGSSLVMMSIAQNGNTSIAGTLSQASDKRLKTNINDINNGLDLVSKINGVTYNWKGKNKDKRLQYGVIAQDIEKVIPELVSEDDKGIKIVNYVGITPVLVEAVKELKKQNENNTKEIELLKKEIELLKSKK